jgi:hypothetical protein
MIGLNIRDRSSIRLSLHKCGFQLRISARIAFTALSETAGLKLMKNFPLRFSLRANIDETVLLVVITEQGENRNQCEEQWNLFGFLDGFARRGT